MQTPQPVLVTSPVIQVIFGALLAIAAAPAFMFQAIGYLQGRDIGVLPGSEMASILTAAVLLVLGLVIMTWRHRVSVDKAARALIWTRHTLGLSWTSATWSRDEIRAIELVRTGGRYPGYRIQARTDRRSKTLYERSAISPPHALANELAGRLKLPLTRLDRPPG